ncbi:MAG: GntR family transcriptional regulator [Firmicutes bacterium]|jgi:DNA-binding GntR family transcriptional regulator|nr:GntR family transcriptional regulator [Bacillota bacterium]
MKAPLASFDPSNARTIRELVYETLREAIFEGELRDGDRLIEKKLADRLHVSRTSVREAMRKLETEGLIQYLPRRGVVVRGITPEAAIEIYAIREALEVAVIPFVIQNITAEEIGLLRQLVTEMGRLTVQGDAGELFGVARHFNDILVKSSRMPQLIKLIDTYQEYQSTFRRVTLSKESRKPFALQEHAAILQAIEEGDVARAEQVMRQHLRAAREEYLRVFEAGVIRVTQEPQEARA